MHADSSSRYLFEAISAASTCGLSLDMTPKLSEAGRILVSLCMYLGRLGPITVVMAISSKLESSHICYPEEDVVVG
jgi:trk system potassium uptake protein TrkH